MIKGSIKNRLLSSFVVVVVSTVIILDILLAVFTRSYYYNNTERLLENQMEIATTFYSKYFSGYSLEESIYDNVDIFWNQTDAQVQIYNISGDIIMDSIGVVDDGSKYYDIKRVLSGEETVRWIGDVSYSDYKVMSVSMSIKDKGNVIGVMRYVVSLEGVDDEIENVLIIYILVSALVLVVSLTLSLLIARDIVTPIKSLTRVAERMAKGDLKVESDIKDDNEIGKLAETLNYMASQLADRDKLKNEFISSVSHELRTPLTAIRGWVITINDEKTDKETLNMGLNIIQKESERLGNMVEELLDFSRLQNGKTEINKSRVDILEFVEYLQMYLSQRAKRENKRINISCELKDTLVYFDLDKMKQVILNIIDNALKFSEEDTEIEMTIMKNKNNIIIKIIDNGCGISKEDLPRVKEKFYKGKNVKSQNGIGLAICDEIVRLHGGELDIESELNCGTTVIIKLPIDGGVLS